MFRIVSIPDAPPPPPLLRRRIDELKVRVIRTSAATRCCRKFAEVLGLEHLPERLEGLGVQLEVASIRMSAEAGREDAAAIAVHEQFPMVHPRVERVDDRKLARQSLR